MKNKIITIGRQYGSGGRTAGKAISDILGIPFYDRAIVDLAAKESGLAADFIESGEQKVTSSMLYNIAVAGYNGYFTDAGNTLTDKIYLAESKVIRDIAKSSCVILGRCADYILRDDYDCFNVFFYAPLNVRAERIASELNISLKEAEKAAKSSDKKRARHYEHYTGRTWGKSENYNLCIDGGTIDGHTAAEIIITASCIK